MRTTVFVGGVEEILAKPLEIVLLTGLLVDMLSGSEKGDPVPLLNVVTRGEVSEDESLEGSGREKMPLSGREGALGDRELVILEMTAVVDV